MAKAKIFKVSGYLVDPTGRLNANQIKSKMQYGCGFPMIGQHIHVEQADIEELDENHPIMQENCDLADCEKYFPNKCPVYGTRKVKVGGIYRHFKGNTVEVLAVSQDTETPGQFYVVYKYRDGSIWSRPYGMFISEVDHEKYPNVQQKYRFELMEWDTENPAE